jgi:hypothetical protein
MDITPRAVNVGLPRGGDSDDPQEAINRPKSPNAHIQRTTTETVPTPSRHHHHHKSGCPHRDEDVLSALQLLAHLSKYPHVRQAFYQPRTGFHPETATLKPQASEQSTMPIAGPSRGKDTTSLLQVIVEAGSNLTSETRASVIIQRMKPDSTEFKILQSPNSDEIRSDPWNPAPNILYTAERGDDTILCFERLFGCDKPPLQTVANVIDYIRQALEVNYSFPLRPPFALWHLHLHLHPPRLASLRPY